MFLRLPNKILVHYAHCLMFLLKLGNACYFHNVSSSSGSDHVNGHSRMELEVQAK